MSQGLHPLWGLESLRLALSRAVAQGTLPATLLLHGQRGVGKQRLGLWLAQLLLCQEPEAGGPCGRCRACRLALRVEHPDLHWYFPLPRPSGSLSPARLGEALEEARGEALNGFRANPLRPSFGEEPRAIYMAAAQSLRRRAQRRPSEGDTQVFLIADAETLVPQEASQEAANALLKLLEEPSEGTCFILTSSEPGQLLPTIRSRSLPIHVTGLTRGEVERFLVAHASSSEADAARAARLSGGAIGRAMAFLPDAKGELGPLDRLRRESLEVLEAALSADAAEGLARALAQRPFGARGLTELLDSLEEWLRDLAAVQASAQDAVLHADEADRLVRLSARISPDPGAPMRTHAALDEARLGARGNVNPQLLLVGLVTAIRRHLLAPTAGVLTR